MNKKGLAGKTAVMFAAIFSAIVICACADADNTDITVKTNGEILSFDVSPCIINERTMVPMRGIFEALGAEISWDDETKTVTAKKDGDIIMLTAGSYEIIKNNAVSATDSPAVIENGRMLVPLRAVGDALDVDVEWDSENRTVNIITENNDNDSWKENTGEINLDTMTVSGNGAAVEGNIIKITQGGDFTVSGTLADGMIQVNTDSKVKLRLDNVNITNTSGPAIFFENCKKGYITLKKGSNNFLSDSSEYSVDAKAVIFSNDDLKISGSGTLNINANKNNAISSDDKIDIDEGTINILSCKNDGIHANEDITIANASITITADGDGIQSENAVTLSNTNLNITTNGDVVSSEYTVSDDTAVKSSEGIKAETSITVTSGNIKIHSTDNAVRSADKIFIHGGSFDIASEYGKGIKGNGDVTINGGDINIIKSTEGIESKGILTINDGNIDITASDDGLNAGGGNTIGGNGMPHPNIGGMPNEDNVPPDMGEIPNRDNVPPDLSGIDKPQRRNGLNDTSGIPQRDNNISRENIRGRGDIDRIQSDNKEDITENEFKNHNRDVNKSIQNVDNTEHKIIINGGNINIVAKGDGIDSNGDLIINGGNVFVNGSESGGDGALDSGDFNSEIYINGGTVIASGMAGMYETPSSESVQCIANIFFDNTMNGGKTFFITDEMGNTIIEYTPTNKYECATVSSPLFEAGKTYNVYTENKDNLLGTFTASSESSVGTRSSGNKSGRAFH